MRIRVQDILELFAAGQSNDQILADFPDLEPEDLNAALAYAARQIDHPVLVGRCSGWMPNCLRCWPAGSTPRGGVTAHLRDGDPWVEIHPSQ
jgi:hypothetical protein